jgi:type III restriction enzyme
MMSEEILHEQIRKNLDSIFSSVPFIPEYLRKNLQHDLRHYQERALEHLIHLENSNNKYFGNHLLFHMATGSGKTLILAATILYYFKEQGFQNFLFFVNSDAIIRKTKDNLANTTSPKYLFDPNGIEIDGRQISIKLVDVFPNIPDESTVYLKLSSIQKLHQLEQPRENGLTYESLVEQRTLLLSDEAHHINVETRKRKNKETKKEQEERNWERTVRKILNIHPENKMIEFTATLDLSNDYLFEKYKDKVVYQYQLKDLMLDGYSKNVFMVKSSDEDDEKMLNSVLLSQYRKYIAKEVSVDLKPIILFKSNDIMTSTKVRRRFSEILNSLSRKSLVEKIRKEWPLHNGDGNVWDLMYSYYSSEINIDQLVNDIKHDFVDETILKVDSKDLLSENNAVLLNTLEDINNPIRAIFAVSKLNEGWDVLNLFDIVRISEKAGTGKGATDSEAQLIGRGARYNPFYYEETFSSSRRFDIENKRYRILESLHYHTINDHKYIKHLIESLDKEGVVTREDRSTRYEAHVKKIFKQTQLFQHGKIFINQEVSTTADDYKTLEDYQITPTYEVLIEQSEVMKYGATGTERDLDRYHEIKMPLEKRLLQKGIQRNKFFRFNHLKKYMPAIRSMKDFLEGEKFLGRVNILVRLPVEWDEKDLSYQEKLRILESFLKYVEEQITRNYGRKRGTPKFIGESFSSYIQDYVVETNVIENNVIRRNENIKSYPMNNYSWYIYDHAVVNGWEKNLIDEIAIFMSRLKEKYSEVYLIRNERKIKVREIGGVRGFMPDFLLYMKDESTTYQVFLEPKGTHLKDHDRWKEKFLLSLTTRDDIEILHESKTVKLIGIKFYSPLSDEKQAFKKDFEEKLLTSSDVRADE